MNTENVESGKLVLVRKNLRRDLGWCCSRNQHLPVNIVQKGWLPLTRRVGDGLDMKHRKTPRRY